MTHCVQALLFSAIRRERECIFSKRLGTETNSSYDEEMSLVLSFCTRFVAGEISPEYETALKRASEYEYELPDGADGQCVLVTGKSTHEIDLTDSS